MKLRFFVSHIPFLKLSNVLVLLLATIPFFLLLKGIISVGRMTWDTTLSPTNPAQAKASQPEATCTPYAKDIPAVGFIPQKFVISSIGIELPVKPANFSNSSWKNNSSTAYIDLGASTVNKFDGNVGIFGLTTKDGFESIKNVQIGQKIEVSNKEFTAQYETTKVDNNGTFRTNLFPYSEEPILTVVGIDGATMKKSTILRAKLIHILINCYETH